MSDVDPEVAGVEQEAMCVRFGTEYVDSPRDLKVGIDPHVRDGITPLNGLRHLPEGDTTGWYIWAGETLSDDPGFFQPVHVSHLGEWCPAAIPYLGLPPGWRFLLAPGHEDVWYDDTLLA
jgi:hypothetical protein